MCVKQNFLVFLLLAILFLTFSNAEETFKTCCKLGTNWANEKLDCSTFPVPIAGIQADKQNLCLQSVKFCCNRLHQVKKCDEGRETAKANKPCSQPNGNTDPYFKECCESCKFGLSIKTSGGTCTSEDGFSPSVIACCVDSTTTTQITTQSTTTQTTTELTTASSIIYQPATESTTTKNTDKLPPPPMPELESLCEEYGNELCAHICVSVPGSYKCECRKGFVLMNDGKSCQQKDVSDRCKINNPCQHHCFDTGVAVRCSCEPGYRLNPDKKTCRDIDECKEGLVKCDPSYKCINDLGTYHCAEPDLSTEIVDKFRECPSGYTYNYDTDVCDDYDECLWMEHNCGDKMCQNIIGSYTCIEKENTNPIECPKGYYYKSSIQNCADIDECATGADDCNKDSQICLNTYGSFTCQERASRTTCVAGFKITSLGTCEDINECVENIQVCKANEECMNEVGGYRCLLKNNTDHLKLSNPTLETTPPSSKTESTITKPIPRTQPPYQNTSSSIHTRATPENLQSTTTTQGISSTRQPSENPYIHSRINETNPYQPTNPYDQRINESKPPICQLGHRFVPMLNRCVDINECDEDSQACDSNQDCVNTIGSYTCRCKTGFRLDTLTGACEDINECQYNLHDCQLYQRCDNTIGSYQCVRMLSCGTGYTLNAANSVCEDDNECLLGTHDCHVLGPNFQCRNTVGSFRCERKKCTQNCNDKKTIYTIPTIIFKPANGKAVKPLTSVHIQTCLPGFVKNSYGGCEDIDECRSSPCERHQKCFNTNGSYKCLNLVHCQPGFKLTENGTFCEDIDECETGTHKCTGNQKCINRNGYHICQCPIGTTPNHLNQCEDIDECKLDSVYHYCSRYSECQNTYGSYLCKCKDGFRDVPEGNTCDDIDECVEQPGLCHQTCVNTWGGYRCACNPGFRLNNDNRTCTDIDECEEFKDKHLCVGICQNTPGSYKCRCPEGFKLGSNGRTCLDIDECERGNICPNPSDICWNTRGSYRCNTIRCPPNYIRDPEHKSRCKRAINYCHSSDKACLQMPNSYSFHFINFPSRLPLPHSGYIELFTLRGLQSNKVVAFFNMKMLDVRCPNSVPRANINYFKLQRVQNNEVILLLSRMIEGPQEMDIELSMEIHHNGEYKGSYIAKILILVSQYEF